MEMFSFNEIAPLQAVPTSNGTSFDFVTTENGPVSLDLYSTPQYKRDKHGDCMGEPSALFPPTPQAKLIKFSKNQNQFLKRGDQEQVRQRDSARERPRRQRGQTETCPGTVDVSR